VSWPRAEQIGLFPGLSGSNLQSDRGPEQLKHNHQSTKNEKTRALSSSLNPAWQQGEKITNIDEPGLHGHDHLQGISSVPAETRANPSPDKCAWLANFESMSAANFEFRDQSLQKVKI
jgi:hypothetical protein